MINTTNTAHVKSAKISNTLPDSGEAPLSKLYIFVYSLLIASPTDYVMKVSNLSSWLWKS